MKEETILAVVPEDCSGPGWSNRVFWVYIQDGNGKIRQESIQYDELKADGHELRTLFHVGAVCAASLIRAVKARKK